MQSIHIGACLALVSGAAGANIAYLESGIGVTFEGCDLDKLINLKNG